MCILKNQGVYQWVGLTKGENSSVEKLGHRMEPK